MLHIFLCIHIILVVSSYRQWFVSNTDNKYFCTTSVAWACDQAAFDICQTDTELDDSCQKAFDICQTHDFCALVCSYVDCKLT